MSLGLGSLPIALCLALRPRGRTSRLWRTISTSRSLTKSVENPPKGHAPEASGRGPPAPPSAEKANLESNSEPASFLGTTKRMPEFNLTDKVVLVSGAARGLGLTQAEALLEAGAKVYALDRLPEPSPDFFRVQKRAADELGTTFYYRQIDVRNVEGLNEIVSEIADTHGRMDGLVAAAGIQQETTALEYTAKDANLMFEINITGVFMTAQAVARQMIKFGNGGSIALIASMSATIANRVGGRNMTDLAPSSMLRHIGFDMSGVQCFEGGRCPASTKPCIRVGPVWYKSQYDIARIYCNGNG